MLSAHKKPPIIISSDSSDSSESMYHHDGNVLLKWLNDNHISCARYMLKKQFSQMSGLQCTATDSTINLFDSMYQGVSMDTQALNKRARNFC